MSLSIIKAHLGLPHNAWTTRQLRPQVDALLDAGLLEHGRRHGIDTLGVTAKGRRRLSTLHSAGKLGELPEAPQHRHWREAHELAAERIDALRGDMQAALDEAGRVIYARSDADSDAWFEMSERLQRAARRVGSATYCLREWAEPDDAKADTDDRLNPDEKRLDRVEKARRRARRQGRRNTGWGAE
ncbi:MAG TPA: hypothetical protein VFY36_00600 [Solirubrobacteraceae bacterium]|nr:hypothetical protein [Solirubrobacteraceae bacterium]